VLPTEGADAQTGLLPAPHGLQPAGFSLGIVTSGHDRHLLSEAILLARQGGLAERIPTFHSNLPVATSHDFVSLTTSSMASATMRTGTSLDRDGGLDWA
jgi:hypothetical protein